MAEFRITSQHSGKGMNDVFRSDISSPLQEAANEIASSSVSPDSAIEHVKHRLVMSEVLTRYSRYAISIIVNSGGSKKAIVVVKLDRLDSSVTKEKWKRKFLSLIFDLTGFQIGRYRVAGKMALEYVN